MVIMASCENKLYPSFSIIQVTRGFVAEKVARMSREALIRKRPFFIKALWILPTTLFKEGKKKRNFQLSKLHHLAWFHCRDAISCYLCFRFFDTVYSPSWWKKWARMWRLEKPSKVFSKMYLWYQFTCYSKHYFIFRAVFKWLWMVIARCDCYALRLA